MSKRAEERGLEALPPRWRKTKDGKGKVDSALPVRKSYIRAYEQAEKDLEPLIEAATIVYEVWNGGTMDDVRREMVELGKVLNARKEQPVEGLEEEIEFYLDHAELATKCKGISSAEDYFNDLKATARHFAEWGAEHLKR